MKRLLVTCWMTVICFSAGIGGETVIFSGKERKFIADWSANTGAPLSNQISNDVGDGPGAGSVEVILGGTEPLASNTGMSIGVNPGGDQRGSAIPLTDAMKSAGVLMIKLNGGKGQGGSEAADGAPVPLTFELAFMATNGERIVVPSRVSIKLDGDPTSWETVEIPLADIMGRMPDKSLIAGLGRIYIRYTKTPACGFYIGDCSIQTP